MTKNAMTLERFATILDAYGGEVWRWPAEERVAAERLLTASPEARALRERAAILDRALEEAPSLRPSPALRRAVLQTAPAAPRAAAGPSVRDIWTAVIRGIAGWRVAGPVLAASLMLGIVTGGALNVGATHAASTDLLQLTWLDDDDFAGY